MLTCTHHPTDTEQTFKQDTALTDLEYFLTILLTLVVGEELREDIILVIFLKYLQNWEFVSYEKYATIWNSLNDNKYRKFASSNTSRLEAHEGFFRLFMKGIFDLYVLWPFDKKLIF